MNKEYRIFKGQITKRAEAAASGSIDGYAAVFNSETDLGYFHEKIAPGAFAKTIADGDDVRALFNHDPNMVLGRTKSGTLRLKEDNTGLKFDVDLPDTQAARDLHTLVERGDVDQCSFGFYVRAEEVERRADGSVIRTITDAQLFDVSPVTYPAYESTSCEARSAVEVSERLKSVVAAVEQTELVDVTDENIPVVDANGAVETLRLRLRLLQLS